jgi:flagella basal body P-ring formation protein FlgA
MKRFFQLGAILAGVATLHAATPDITAVLKAELQKRGAKFDNLQVDPFNGPIGEGLEVTRIQYDPVHSKTYFQIRDSHKRTFEVGAAGSILFPTLIASHELAVGAEVSASDFTVDYRPLSAMASPSPDDLAGRHAQRKIAAGEMLRPEMFTQACAIQANCASRFAAVSATALVQPGRPAILKVEGPGFVLERQVIPLDAGAAGQTIRVRAPETNRIFKAVVVDRDQLKGEQQ